MSKKALVVDDALFMRTVLKKILTADGFDVFEASDGAEAVSAFPSVQPDVVLMDVTMPNLDGLSAAKQIISQHPGARVVMCTAVGQQSVVTEAMEAGAAGFIVKPFQPDKVRETVSKVMGA